GTRGGIEIYLNSESAEQPHAPKFRFGLLARLVGEIKEAPALAPPFVSAVHPQIQNRKTPKVSNVRRHRMARCPLGVTIRPGGGPWTGGGAYRGGAPRRGGGGGGGAYSSSGAGVA